MKTVMKKLITFRITATDEIKLNAFSEHKAMNRSEYINHCITREFERVAIENKYKELVTDIERREKELGKFKSAISELNVSVNRMTEENNKNFDLIKKAFIELFPGNRQVLLKLFNIK